MTARAIGVSGVRGSAESSYRRGEVSITPANLGIGTVQSNLTTASVSVPTATDTKLCSLDVPAGTYVVCYGIAWSASASGARVACLSTSGDMDGRRHLQHYVAPVSGYVTRQNHTTIMQLSSASTLWVVGRQTSGATLTADPYVCAVKVA